MSKKEIAKKEATQEIQVYTETKSMGVADEVTSADVQIPSLMLMQANAELVKDRNNEIKSGDFVHSITQDIWGSIDSPTELVVVDMYKTEVITQIEGNVWKSTKPWTPDMEALPYEFELDNKTHKRQKCYNYICFRPLEVREITLPDDTVHYVASPIIVKFKGASSKNAKKFNQLLRDYATFNQPSWCVTFDLKAYEDKNEHGTFFVYNFEKRANAVKETQLAAAKLCEMSQAARKAGTMEVIDAEEVNVEKTVGPNPGLKNHAPGAEEDLF